MLALALFVATATTQPGTTNIPKPDTVSPGFAGFVTVFLLTVATILLIRSMTRHMRKVRYSPDPADPGTTTRDRPQDQTRP